MSSFGKIFKVTTFGESHGIGVGCIIENVPPLLQIKEEDIQYQLNRRKPNQNSLLSNRNEPDIVEIYSGVHNGVTLGTPVSLIVKNVDMKPNDYKDFSNIPRPGHADLTYLSKYGVKSSSGGGRSSARETVARVAAGAVAEKYLKDKFNVEIVSWVNSIGDIEIPKSKEILVELTNDNNLTKKQLDSMSSYDIFKLKDKEESKIEMLLLNKHFKRIFYLIQHASYEIDENYFEKEIDFSCAEFESDEKIIIFNNTKFTYFETINIRCPHPDTAVKMISKIMKIKSECDSIGGTVSCIIRNCPRSLGEPCFDKFEAELAKAMLSIPATKGFEIGSGFEGTKMK